MYKEFLLQTYVKYDRILLGCVCCTPILGLNFKNARMGKVIHYYTATQCNKVNHVTPVTQVTTPNNLFVCPKTTSVTVADLTWITCRTRVVYLYDNVIVTCKWYQPVYFLAAWSGLYNLGSCSTLITSFPLFNRDMKWKWLYVPHHNHERVDVLTLGKACFCGQIPVWDRVWRRQWRSHHPSRQSWASASGLSSS